MPITPSGAQVWRDYVTEGVPASGVHKVPKSSVRAWSQSVESLLEAVATAAAIFDTRANLYATLTYAANTLAWVVADGTAAFNGVYRKIGASNTGSWVRVAELPYSFVRMTDAGAGTANAIQLTSSIPTSASVLRVANVFEANTGDVTVSENGGTARALLTASGNQIASGGLVAGMMIAYVDNGSTFRLLSDQASAAIQAAAEAAAIAAADYAALARNDVVVNPFVGDGTTLDWPLTVDPGTANNMRVNISGVSQLRTSYSLVYVSSVPTLRMTEAIADGIPFEVEMGFRIAVGTPADGSVTYGKIQNVTSALRLLGRKAGSGGVVQEITPQELRDLFLPVGSVVQNISAIPYVANAALSGNIPLDDTIPQITEGTQILTATITPSSVSNKLRIRFAGVAVPTKVGASDITWAIFNGGANAIRSGSVVSPDAGYPVTLTGEVEYVPGVLTAQTISVRVGANGASTNPVRMNGSAAARLLGGTQGATLIVEEIKV